MSRVVKLSSNVLVYEQVALDSIPGSAGGFSCSYSSVCTDCMFSCFGILCPCSVLCMSSEETPALYLPHISGGAPIVSAILYEVSSYYKVNFVILRAT